MAHYHRLERPDWLNVLNDELNKRGCQMVLWFERDFVLVEEDYLQGTDPDQVAHAIQMNTHPRLAGLKFESNQPQTTV